MLSRYNKNRKKQFKKKGFILIGALILLMSMTPFATSAIAGQDISSMLTNWFANKRTAAINEIDAAITTEKERLMVVLKEELRIEVQAASEQLQQFTDDEKARRIANLQAYAEELKANIKIENSEEKAEIIATLDGIIARAIDELKNAATPSENEEELPPPSEDPTSDQTESDVKDVAPVETPSETPED